MKNISQSQAQSQSRGGTFGVDGKKQQRRCLLENMCTLKRNISEQGATVMEQQAMALEGAVYMLVDEIKPPF
jgi:hypothetical protein